MDLEAASRIAVEASLPSCLGNKDPFAAGLDRADASDAACREVDRAVRLGVDDIAADADA